ncbi:MAG: hypothetical protein AAFX93_08525 [Verrucomicrobiota bacterium]
MGLDGVELIMAVEEEFFSGEEIPESVGEKLFTVGDLYDYVVSRLESQGELEALGEEQVWERLVELIVCQLSVKKEQVTREARFVEDLNVG